MSRLLLLLTMVLPIVSTNTITVATNGEDTIECLRSPFLPCATLDYALEGVHHYSNASVHLSSGTYVLTANESVATFKDTAKFELVGISSTVSIVCGSNVGLSFYNSSNITIKNITLLQCGALHNSSSIDFSKSQYTMNYLQFFAGVYFMLCENIELKYVTVMDSPGTGVVFYSTGGNNIITFSNFINNTAYNRSEYKAGGGGIAIEFLYCIPGDASCSLNSSSYIPEKNRANATFLIENCLFKGNNASTGNYTDDSFVVPHVNYNVALGRGGGVSVLFKGNAQNNTVSMESNTICDNTAIWGGGMLVEFQDRAMDNYVSVKNSSIVENQCMYDPCTYQGTGGGGARVQMAGVDRGIERNAVFFINTIFEGNNAYFGGGLSFMTFPEDSVTNSIIFEAVDWIRNSARLGSAIDLSVWHLTNGLTLQPKFKNCSFIQNTIEYTNVTGTPHGTGTLYADTISINIIGNINFSENTGSAITSTDGSIVFNEFSFGIFQENLAEVGGAISLYNKAHLLVKQRSRLRFISNKAILQGGAIYWEGIGNHDLVSSRNCFIRYEDPYIYPSDWLVLFEFVNNTAGLNGNAIYGSTLLGCLWGGRPYGELIDPQQEYNNVFCWNPSSSRLQSVWNYINSSCSDSIATSPGYFALENGTVNCGSPYTISIIPGTVSSLPVEMLDDRLAPVPKDSLIFSSSANNTDDAVRYTAFEKVPFFGLEGETIDYMLSTIGPRVVSTQILLTFKQCPPGFLLQSDTLECHGASYPFIITNTNLTSSIQRGYWIGKIDGKTVVAQCSYCPYNSELPLSNYILLPTDEQKLDEFFCSALNREGPLCRRCKNGYAPAVNSEFYKCVRCSAETATYSWLLYLLTEYLPTTIILLVVIIFNISVTSGPLNSFVFFAQVISTTFGVDADGLIPYLSITKSASALRQAYTSIYGVWNLNFFLSFDWALFCLGPNVTTLHLLALDYITAIYPLFMLLWIWILVIMYDRNWKIVVCIVRPLHRLFARCFGLLNLHRSVMDAFATFIVLSYAKFAATSAVLLYPNGLYSENGGIIDFVSKYDGNYPFVSSQYAPFLISAILTSLFICVLMPVLLFLYSIKPFYRFLEKIHFTFLLPGEKTTHFLNAFHHCYKDGTDGGYDQRYFASLFFFIKLIIIFSYSYALNWAQQYVIQQILCTIAILLISVFQPYKKMLYNVVDAVIFSILATINVLTLYNRYLDIANLGLDPSSYYIQIILIFTPLLYIIGYAIYCLYQIQYVKTNMNKVRGSISLSLIRKYSTKERDDDDFNFAQFMDDVTDEGRFHEHNYHGPLKPDELNRDVGDEYNAACSLRNSEDLDSTSVQITNQVN